MPPREVASNIPGLGRPYGMDRISPSSCLDVYTQGLARFDTARLKVVSPHRTNRIDFVSDGDRTSLPRGDLLLVAAGLGRLDAARRL